MKSVQKLGSLLLAALMILSLAACGSKTNHTPAQTPSNDTPAENTPAETPDDTPVETPDDTAAETPDNAAAEEPDNSTSGGKVLVAYFSATGSTVIPFATSASSGMGQSGTLLSEMAGTGDWQDGQRFRSNASANDVADWVGDLGL